MVHIEGHSNTRRALLAADSVSFTVLCAGRVAWIVIVSQPFLVNLSEGKQILSFALATLPLIGAH
jgi:hypothetical protein